MRVPRFDIFSGADNSTQWMKWWRDWTYLQRMEFYAANISRSILHLDCSEHTIADTIDTSPPGSATIENVKRASEISAVA